MLKTTQVERRLIEAAQAGELLDVSEEQERDVRAVVIRGLLCGWHTKALDPRGVRLHGAHIVEELDLTDVRALVPLVLQACEHDEPLILTRTHLPHLNLAESVFPDLVGNDFACEHDARFSRINCRQVILTGANIVGDCDLREAQLTATSEPALLASGLTVGGDLLLNRGVASSSDSEYGTLYLAGATITGQLDLSGVQLTAAKGPALHANGATVIGGMFLEEGFTAGADSEYGTLRLLHATITGQLVLREARLTATNGPALHADGLTVRGGMYLSGSVADSSDSESGTLRLGGATITGQLALHEAHLTAPNGPALHADGLTVDADLFLDRGSTVSGKEALRLTGATIMGQLSLNEAQLNATDGPALQAEGLTVGMDLILDKEFTANSDSDDGTLVLIRAAINGFLSLSGAQLAATRGPALTADGATIKRGALLDECFTARSSSESGTLRFGGATITGQLNLRGAQLAAANGPAVQAEGLTVEADLFLDKGFTANSDSEDGTLCFPNARITKYLILNKAHIRNTGGAKMVLDISNVQVGSDFHISLQSFISKEDRSFCLDLDGFRYPFIPKGMTCQMWLTILSQHTPAYAPQPYQQLAAAYRSSGHDQESRKIFIAQQRDLRRRGDLGGPRRELLHILSGVFIGYGHRPFRALGFLAGVCLLSGGVVLSASLLGLAAHPAPSGPPCSLAENFSLVMDTAIPPLKYGGGKRCEILTTTDWGQVLYVATYLLHMLGWAFATLFVAGYTGLVRKTT